MQIDSYQGQRNSFRSHKTINHTHTVITSTGSGCFNVRIKILKTNDTISSDFEFQINFPICICSADQLVTGGTTRRRIILWAFFFVYNLIPGTKKISIFLGKLLKIINSIFNEPNSRIKKKIKIVILHNYNWMTLNYKFILLHWMKLRVWLWKKNKAD